jgi:hypothetical protein
MKAPPPSTKANLAARLNGHARAHWPSLAGIEVRFRAIDRPLGLRFGR